MRSIQTHNRITDEVGLKSLIVQKQNEPKSAASIVSRVILTLQYLILNDMSIAYVMLENDRSSSRYTKQNVLKLKTASV